MVAFLVCLLVLVLISLANFWLYASDKMRAKNNLWRIPEKLLLAVGFFRWRNRRTVWYGYLPPQDQALVFLSRQYRRGAVAGRFGGVPCGGGHLNDVVAGRKIPALAG